MKRIRESVLVKIILFTLAIVCNIVLVTGVFVTSYIKAQGVYDNDKSALIDKPLEHMTYAMLNGPLIEYLEQKLTINNDNSYEKSAEEYETFFAPEHSNFFFNIKDNTGKVVLQNYIEEDYRLEMSTVYNHKYKEFDNKTIVFENNHERMLFNPYRPRGDGLITQSFKVVLNDEGLWQAEITGYYEREDTITINAYLRKELTAEDEFYKHEVFVSKLCDMKTIVPCITLSALTLLIVLMITLVRFAGHRRGKDGICPGLVDRIPFDIVIAVLAVIPIVTAIMINEFSVRYRELIVYIFAIVFLCYMEWFIVTFAVRIKKGSWWKNTVIFKLFKFIICKAIPSISGGIKKIAAVLWSGLKKTGSATVKLSRRLGKDVAHVSKKSGNITVRTIKKVFSVIVPILKKTISALIHLLKSIINVTVSLARKLPFFWKAGLAYVLLIAVELICILLTLYEPDILMIIWAVEKILFVPVLILVVLNLRVLQKGGEQLALGKLEHKIDLRHMLWDFKKHGENLNSINVGMKHAVEEQMKSEHLKTELVTNVSHDIKTPLTAIISYVDLLKREDVQPEVAKQYVEVLDRQSAKLKKLVDDLMEMSKASTGNIEVRLEELDVNVLLSQILGDYVERLEVNKVTLVTNYCSEVAMVSADGQLLWRVFDNLMSNICKYTLEGTRVYINTKSSGDDVKIIFKNISKYELNISSNELMERFVRGDSSRSTEGSGLGLSIAESLMKLQDGRLDLSIDGDLFKAEITLKGVIGQSAGDNE